MIGTFLHDIGHLVGEDQKLETMVSNGTNLGTKDHDKVGAAYLRNFGFPKNILGDAWSCIELIYPQDTNVIAKTGFN